MYRTGTMTDNRNSG